MASRQTRSECYARYAVLAARYQIMLGRGYNQHTLASAMLPGRWREKAVESARKHISRAEKLIHSQPARASRVCEKKKN